MVLYFFQLLVKALQYPSKKYNIPNKCIYKINSIIFHRYSKPSKILRQAVNPGSAVEEDANVERIVGEYD